MKKLIGLLAVALMLVATGCNEFKDDVVLINNTDVPLYCLYIDGKGNKAPSLQTAFHKRTPRLVRPEERVVVGKDIFYNSETAVFVYVFFTETLDETPLLDILQQNICDNVFAIKELKARETNGIFLLMPDWRNNGNTAKIPASFETNDN